MVVGAGFGQVPAIQRAAAMGLRVVAVDRDENAPGMAIADVPLVIDVVDDASIVGAAERYDIDGVLTLQSDLPVPSVGAVVDALGLAGQGREVAERCSNKIEARRLLQERGVPQPAFVVIDDLGDALAAVRETGLPAVVKAPDSSGSRGIVKVDDVTELPDAFEQALRYSRDGRVLVEAFVPGIELGAQTLSVAGSCEQVWIHDDEISSPPYMVPIGHWYPSALDARAEGLVQASIARAVEALGIHQGPANVDLILREDETPMILEIGARMGATCLPELTTYHTGIDWVAAAISLALGERPDIDPGRLRPCAAFILEAPRDGVLRSWSPPPGVNGQADLVEWEVTAEPGDRVSELRKGTDRIGKVLTTGDDVSGAVEKARRLRASFTFDVRCEDPLESNDGEVHP